VESTTKPSTWSSQPLVICIECAYTIIIFFMALLQNIVLVLALTPLPLLIVPGSFWTSQRLIRANRFQRAL